MFDAFVFFDRGNVIENQGAVQCVGVGQENEEREEQASTEGFRKLTFGPAGGVFWLLNNFGAWRGHGVRGTSGRGGVERAAGEDLALRGLWGGRQFGGQ